MGRNTSRREAKKLIDSLADHNVDRILNYAKKLEKGTKIDDGGSNRATARKSLAENDGTPSYTAAASVRDYEFEKDAKNAGRWG